MVGYLLLLGKPQKSSSNYSQAIKRGVGGGVKAGLLRKKSRKDITV